MPNETIPTVVVETTTQTKGTLGISFNAPTPMWATWIFRVEFFFNKAFLLWISATDIIPENRIKAIVGTLAAIDFFVWGIGRSIGIKPPDESTK